MKASKILLFAGGIANVLFFLFHVWLGWAIWQWTQLPAPVRSLLEMFNLGGALFIGFLVYASLGHPAALMESKLGRSVCWLAVLFYGTRAAGEFVFSPKPRPAIAATCLVVAAVYLAALFMPASRSDPSQPAAQPESP